MKTLVKHFDKRAYDRAFRDATAFKSRTTMIWLEPRMFLKLTPDLTRPDTSMLEQLLDNGKAFDSVPYLRTEGRGNDHFRVVGHEGRHRSIALMRKRFTGYMPVLLTDMDTRWEEEDYYGRPITLFAQAGNFNTQVVLEKPRKLR